MSGCILCFPQRWPTTVLETAQELGRVPGISGFLQRVHPSGELECRNRSHDVVLRHAGELYS